VPNFASNKRTKLSRIINKGTGRIKKTLSISNRRCSRSWSSTIEVSSTTKRRKCRPWM